MSSFDTKDSLLESVNSLFHSLNKGELSVNELETLVNQTRELYERAIVLRHKAYEKSVIKNLEPHILVPLEEAIVTPIENVPEIISETIDKQENITVKEFEQPTFDMSFSLFDELESESKPLEDTNEEVIIPENVQMTETVVEPITAEIKEEIAVVEPVVEVVNSSEPVNVASQGQKDAFDKMLEVSDNSLGSQLMAKKLDSLTGAFGLNEKLQMTHELFNGSSESFYQAVQLFDTLDNFSQAKDVLNKFKEEFSWNLETTLVTEFVQKIARRYA
ncbi:MAG: hypothetical protein ACK48V_03765 [Crocinitomicaceae bacterium]|jgi:hypothetical protein